MKKTIIAAMLAIATFVSFSAQAQTADDNTTKTEQCQKKECKKDKKECKKDKKECKKGDKKGKKGDKKHKGGEARMNKDCKKAGAMFKGIDLTDEQKAQIKDARKEVRMEEQKLMDAKMQTILTPEQYTIYQQNMQNKCAIKAKKAEMRENRVKDSKR